MPSTGLLEEEDLGVSCSSSSVYLLSACVYMHHAPHEWKYGMFSNLVEYECMLQVHLLLLVLGCHWLRLPQWLCPRSALVGWFSGWRPATVLWVHIFRWDLMQSGLLAGLRHQLHTHRHTHANIGWQTYTAWNNKNVSICVKSLAMQIILKCLKKKGSCAGGVFWCFPFLYKTQPPWCSEMFAY